MSTKLKSPAADTAVDQITGDLAMLHAAAEQIIWELEPEQVPTAAQRKILKQVGIETRDDVMGECGRVAAVRELMAQSGSPEAYRAAELDAIEAARFEAERRPALEEKLAEIQAQLDELAEGREQAEEVLESFQHARARLRLPQMLPRHVRDAWESDQQAVRTRHRKKISEVEVELTVLVGLERIDLGTADGVKAARLHCESAQPNLITRTLSQLPPQAHLLHDPNGHWQEQFSVEGFRTYRERRLAERPKLEAKLAKLRADLDRELSEVAALLDHYVKQL
jgi:hypothetical protein